MQVGQPCGFAMQCLGECQASPRCLSCAAKAWTSRGFCKMVQHLLLGRHQGLKHVVDPRLVIPTLIMYFDMHPAGRMPGTREIFAHTWAMYSYTNAAGPGHDLHHLSKAQGLTGMCVCSPGSLAACTGISSDQKRCHGIILAAIPPEDNAMQEFPCGTGTP